MDQQDQKYFNFPIHLLRNAFGSIKYVLDEVLAYAGYVHSRKLDVGTNQKKMKCAGDFFGITYGNAAGSYESGMHIYNQSPKNSPMTGISKSILFDYYQNDKTEFEIAVLLAFLAIKSIVGNKPFACITNHFLITRMAGYSKVDELPDPIPSPLSDYYTRRKLDRIKFELRENWGVNIYGYRLKGFYISFEKTFPLEKLVFEAEKNRKNAKEIKQKNIQDQARIQAIQVLLSRN